MRIVWTITLAAALVALASVRCTQAQEWYDRPTPWFGANYAGEAARQRFELERDLQRSFDADRRQLDDRWRRTIREWPPQPQALPDVMLPCDYCDPYSPPPRPTWP